MGRTVARADGERPAVVGEGRTKLGVVATVGVVEDAGRVVVGSTSVLGIGKLEAQAVIVRSASPPRRPAPNRNQELLACTRNLITQVYHSRRCFYSPY